MKLEPKNLRPRYGQIEVSQEVLKRTLAGDLEAVAVWNAVFTDFVVVKVEHRFDRDSVEYTGYNANFEALPEEHMGMVPRYGITITRTQESNGVISFGVKFEKPTPSQG